MPAALIESRFNRSKSTAEYKNNFGLRGCISNFTPQTRESDALNIRAFIAICIWFFMEIDLIFYVVYCR